MEQVVDHQAGLETRAMENCTKVHIRARRGTFQCGAHAHLLDIQRIVMVMVVAYCRGQVAMEQRGMKGQSQKDGCMTEVPPGESIEE